jgi:hypothetical protein
MSERVRKWTAAEAEAALAELDKSGLSVVEFARSRGVAAHRLWRWRRQLRRAVPAKRPRVVELVPREPFRDGGAGGARGADGLCLRLHCPSGHTLEWRAVDLAESLHSVLRALREAAC